MPQGHCVFTKLCSFIPKRIFDCLVDKYDGNKWVKSFTCWHHLLVMVFGQLSNRKSMRDLIVLLNAHCSKFYRLGLGKSVPRSNLSKANEVREARIFTSENAVNIQIYSAIIAYCLVAIVGSELKLKISNYDVLRVVGVSLFDKTPLKEFLKDESIGDSGESDKQLWLELEDQVNYQSVTSERLTDFRGH